MASFTDVPLGYWAFQYIKALKASGITQGVTPTTYEPESNVTRAQMAVFLAKALGLHWPNRTLLWTIRATHACRRQRSSREGTPRKALVRSGFG